MGFCFRNNISSCCVTLHDVLIAEDYASFMPSACVQDFPEWEILACYGCHFTQPKTMYTNEFYTPDKPRTSSEVKYVINLCENYVQRWYGQDDLSVPSTRWDDCGFHAGDGVVIPSTKFANAEQMLNAFKPTFFDTEEFYFKIVPNSYGNSTSACFNQSLLGLDSLSLLMVIGFVTLLFS